MRIEIAGKNYLVVRAQGSEHAPVIWRLHSEEGESYYVCRLADGTIQCDCAAAVFGSSGMCKHWRGLATQGLI
jgi:hypothetical protein